MLVRHASRQRFGSTVTSTSLFELTVPFSLLAVCAISEKKQVVGQQRVLVDLTSLRSCIVSWQWRRAPLEVELLSGSTRLGLHGAITEELDCQNPRAARGSLATSLPPTMVSCSSRARPAQAETTRVKAGPARDAGFVHPEVKILVVIAMAIASPRLRENA